jgi:CheY-like chemotaxis protein
MFVKTLFNERNPNRRTNRRFDGSTVRIYLPRHDMMQVEAVGLQDVRDVPMRDPEAIIGTVLVVEDEADLRALIVEVLRDLGCRVIEAANGNAGLRFLRSRGQVDLLVTDVGLPEMNGRQLAATARETRPGPAVLLITGYAGKALDDMELAPGMKVMVKPFALNSLAVRVGALLKSHDHSMADGPVA